MTLSSGSALNRPLGRHISCALNTRTPYLCRCMAIAGAQCQDNISLEGGDSSAPGQCPPSATRPTEALATRGAARAKHPAIRYLRRHGRSFNTLLCDGDAESNSSAEEGEPPPVWKICLSRPRKAPFLCQSLQPPGSSGWRLEDPYLKIRQCY